MAMLKNNQISVTMEMKQVTLRIAHSTGDSDPCQRVKQQIKNPFLK